MSKYGLPLADEMLNPHLLDYVDDLYTYLAV
jgi:3-deoxy-D-arabino-heptulosonate 7-phosphate (DAHP) synthase